MQYLFTGGARDQHQLIIKRRFENRKGRRTANRNRNSKSEGEEGREGEKENEREKRREREREEKDTEREASPAGRLPQGASKVTISLSFRLEKRRT